MQEPLTVLTPNKLEKESLTKRQNPSKKEPIKTYLDYEVATFESRYPKEISDETLENFEIPKIFLG